MDGQESDFEVPSRANVSGIFAKYHDLEHPGMNCTVKSIQRRYYWLGMYTEIVNYVISHL